jgi:hypothetical protein
VPISLFVKIRILHNIRFAQSLEQLAAKLTAFYGMPHHRDKFAKTDLVLIPELPNADDISIDCERWRSDCCSGASYFASD